MALKTDITNNKIGNDLGIFSNLVIKKRITIIVSVLIETLLTIEL